jgi:hypothetical protein
MFVTSYTGSILMLVLRRAHETGMLRKVVLILLLWVAAELAIGVEGAGMVVPPNLLMFALTVVLLTGAWIFAPALRRAAAGTRLTSLISIHVWRLGGFLFLLLYLANRLPFPFAPVAAIGDMLAAAFAIGLLAALRRSRAPGRNLIAAWNGFGMLDLIVAVGLALLAVPGTPFQLFTQVPARSAFTELPWILVPAAIVPLLFFDHLAIFLNLRGEREGAPGWSGKEARA